MRDDELWKREAWLTVIALVVLAIYFALRCAA